MTKQILKISIQGSKVKVFLISGKKEIDTENWNDENNMSKKLLVAIDILLKRNKLNIADVGGIDVVSDQQSYTSTRIARAVAKTVDCCLV